MSKKSVFKSKNAKPIAVMGVALIAALALLVCAGAEIAAGESNDNRLVEVYDDFSDGGAEYDIKWVTWDNFLPGLVLEPEAFDNRDFSNERLYLEATPFTISYDFFYDHVKYLATSTQAFPIPESGSITVSADITALTPGAEAGHVLPTTGRALWEGQQAAASLHLINLETGQLFDWFVSENTAFCIIERLFVGVGLDKGYTHIFNEFAITPGTHTFAIRYERRHGNTPDKIPWLMDGAVKATLRDAGIPLDVQDPGKYVDIVWPSLGPGEPVKDLMTEFVIGHGLFSLLDEFPFNQFPDYMVSIPEDERIFGQGVAATFDNFTVITKGQ
jgi:hypothetical protein